MAKEATIKRTDMLKVPLNQIDVQEGFNVREEENFGDIDGLARQIAKQGQKQPLKGVRNGERVTLTAGHRRLRAIHLANEKYIGQEGYQQEPIDIALFITEKLDEKGRVLEMLIDGDGAVPLTSSEMVKGINRLLEMGVPRKEVVDSLGMGLSQAQKYNLVKAAEAPKAVQEMMDKGVISPAKVNELQRSTSTDEELVDAATKFSEEKKEQKAQPRQPREKKENPVVVVLEQAIALSDPTGAKVATLTAIVRKLKSGASAEDIAKLLK